MDLGSDDGYGVSVTVSAVVSVCWDGFRGFGASIAGLIIEKSLSRIACNVCSVSLACSCRACSKSALRLVERFCLMM